MFDEIIRRKRFSEKDAAIVMKQVLSAVNYCHSQSIVHRDLKPENILLEDKDSDKLVTKVIDFGASQVFDPDEKLTERFGTIYYISPEVLKGDYGEKCDLWSLGVILYILLCGEPPFNGDSDDKIMAKILKGKFDFKQNVWSTRSNESKDLISRMLTFKYDDRISAEDALQHAWFKSKLPDDSHVDMQTIQNLHDFRVKKKT